MDLTSILILSSLALLVGLITNLAWKKHAIFILNISILLSLQPNLPIRGLRFWLPSVLIFLCLISWMWIRNKQNFSNMSIVKPIGIIALIYLIIYLINTFIANSVPFVEFQLQTLILFIGFLLIFIAINFIIHPKRSSDIWISILIILFIVLKTPQLAFLVSKGLRVITNQALSLANPMDISWLGFSYIVFRLIHTLRDHKSGRLPNVDLVEYINYVTFFPTLTAGPIDRFQNYKKSFENSSKPLREKAIIGGKRIIQGLFKKFVIADLLVMIALNDNNALQIQSASWMWISVYAYAFLIYFDFSGYTDIAIGMGYLMGIEVPENFSLPYLKTNLTLFWNSWHMTLTNFFRAYFFNPLTRYLRTGKRKWRVWLIILFTQITTMVLIGLWHGIIASFIFWGLWHGIGLFIQNRWSNTMGVWIEEKINGRLSKKVLKMVNVLLTFNFIAIGWIFFALSEIEKSISVLKVLVGIR